jgi:hypothetical protein
MTARRTGTIALAALLAAAAACKGPAVPHPMQNETRYLCCNLHYEKTKINDANYAVGSLIPLGTPVQIQEVGRNQVTFVPAGHPPITLVYRYQKKALPFDEFLNRLFVAADPRANLPRATAARAQTSRKKGSRGAPPVDTRAEKVRQNIEHGVVDDGMTRDQVIMALGYPPAHETPSLQSPVWTYWQNAWARYQVYFDGDRVSRVAR